MKRTLCIALQTQYGALDRVLGALTHRGLLPEELISLKDAKSGCFHLMVSFLCEDNHCVEKLMRAIEKQINVLSVESVFQESQAEGSESDSPAMPSSNVAQLFPSHLSATRRTAHVSHA